MDNPFVSRNNFKVIKQAGFSLLESLAVIGVASALVLAGMAFYQGKKQELDVDVSIERIKRMHSALNQFYALNCLNGSNPAVSSALLLSNGLLFSIDDVTTTFGNAITPSINWVGSPVVLSVSTTVDTTALSFWENKYPPTVANGAVLTWTKLPSYITGQTLLRRGVLQPCIIH
jgi:type II secretory pathway pseudopilin PulG